LQNPAGFVVLTDSGGHAHWLEAEAAARSTDGLGVIPMPL